MPIIAENKASDYVLMPAGNHMARCFGMVELGTIKEETGQYAGKLIKKVRLSFETPLEAHDFGKGELEPFVIHKDFTLSMNEKATLRKMLESWRGQPFTDEQAKSFDVTKLLGKPCMLNVIHKKSGKGNEYADITSIASMPKGTTCPDQILPMLELSYDNWNSGLFETLPEFIRNKMKSSKEYSAMMSAPVNELVDNGRPDDDLPF